MGLVLVEIITGEWVPSGRRKKVVIGWKQTGRVVPVGTDCRLDREEGCPLGAGDLLEAGQKGGRQLGLVVGWITVRRTVPAMCITSQYVRLVSLAELPT